jgi:hypothetical protein
MIHLRTNIQLILHFRNIINRYNVVIQTNKNRIINNKLITIIFISPFDM